MFWIIEPYEPTYANAIFFEQREFDWKSKKVIVKKRFKGIDTFVYPGYQGKNANTSCGCDLGIVKFKGVPEGLRGWEFCCMTTQRIHCEA